jgi:Tfp pilus assembly protein PilP
MVKRCLTSTDDDIKSWMMTVSREARLQQTAGFNSFYNSEPIQYHSLLILLFSLCQTHHLAMVSLERKKQT